MISLLFQSPIIFLGALLAIMIAIMSHEVAHGYAALWSGDPTAKYMGRLNFNPQSHFDLFGAIMMLLIGFGYAKPVPINPNNFRNYKKDMIKVSLAGITTNFLLAFLIYPVWQLATPYLNQLAGTGALGYNFGLFFYAFLQYFFSINIVLMVFNLMPIPPLDGFNYLEMKLSPNNRFIRFVNQNRQMMFLVLIIAVYVFDIVWVVAGIVETPILWFWGLIL